MAQSVKIIIERHEYGFIGCPLGFKGGAIIGQGESYDESLADTRSASDFPTKHYGTEAFREGFEHESPLLNAFETETPVVA